MTSSILDRLIGGWTGWRPQPITAALHQLHPSFQLPQGCFEARCASWFFYISQWVMRSFYWLWALVSPTLALLPGDQFFPFCVPRILPYCVIFETPRRQLFILKRDLQFSKWKTKSLREDVEKMTEIRIFESLILYFHSNTREQWILFKNQTFLTVYNSSLLFLQLYANK